MYSNSVNTFIQFRIKTPNCCWENSEKL